MYMLLSGRSPFPGMTTSEVIAKNQKCRVEFPDKHWHSISNLAIDLLLQMLDTDPETRISTEEAVSHEWFSSATGTCEIPTMSFNSLPQAYSPLQLISTTLVKRIPNIEQFTAKRPVVETLDL
jgi:serine/threonine protein kinase